jgi:hypothetical protein
MRFGWTVEYILNMPARRFFVMLKESRDQENQKRWSSMVELCDVAAIPLCNGEYYSQKRAEFAALAMGGELKRGGSVRQFDHKDQRPKEVLKNIFAMKHRTEGLSHGRR